LPAGARQAKSEWLMFLHARRGGWTMGWIDEDPRSFSPWPVARPGGRLRAGVFRYGPLALPPRQRAAWTARNDFFPGGAVPGPQVDQGPADLPHPITIVSAATRRTGAPLRSQAAWRISADPAGALAAGPGFSSRRVEGRFYRFAGAPDPLIGFDHRRRRNAETAEDQQRTNTDGTASTGSPSNTKREASP